MKFLPFSEICNKILFAILLDLIDERIFYIFIYHMNNFSLRSQAFDLFDKVCPNPAFSHFEVCYFVVLLPTNLVQKSSAFVQRSCEGKLPNFGSKLSRHSLHQLSFKLRFLNKFLYCILSSWAKRALQSSGVKWDRLFNILF